MKNIIKRLISIGFVVIGKGDEGETIMSNGTLRIGVFPYDFPHDTWKGHVLAEHEVNFDKWSKHFYRSTIPIDDIETHIVLTDLMYIDNRLNSTVGKSYSTLVRNF